MPIDPTPPQDFDQRRARWIAETQEMLRVLMERHGIQSEAESRTERDAPLVLIVGADMGAAPARVMAHRGADVLVVGSDVPICRDRDPELGLGASGLGRAIAEALSRPVFADALVRIPERPKQTKAHGGGR